MLPPFESNTLCSMRRTGKVLASIAIWLNIKIYDTN